MIRVELVDRGRDQLLRHEQNALAVDRGLLPSHHNLLLSDHGVLPIAARDKLVNRGGQALDGSVLVINDAVLLVNITPPR